MGLTSFECCDATLMTLHLTAFFFMVLTDRP